MDQPHEFTSFVQPTPQQDQSRFQIVLDVWQPQACVQANSLFVNAIRPVPDECLKQLPEEPSGDALNQVGIVDEDAVV